MSSYAFFLGVPWSAGHPKEYNVCVMDLVLHLATLLPDGPARVLLLGWPETFADGVEGTEVHRVAGVAELAPETPPFDAVLWRGDGSENAREAVARLRRLLDDGGRLIVVMPLPADAVAASRRQGSLPSHHEDRLRQIVRHLSEDGFAIRKDQDLCSDDDSQVWKVLVARPDPFSIRSYRDGDQDAILRLFRASFHVERHPDHWRWKYAENPYGACKISLAADGAGVRPPEGGQTGQLAAHYGGYPIPFWRQGRSFLALQIGDTMTDPAVRNAGRGKAGLLARTVRHFFSVHRDGSFGLYYGFNTGPIQRFCRWFIGGSQDRPVRYLARDLEPVPDWRAGGGYRVERIETVGPAWDRFFRRVAPRYRFLVRRDAQYLDWRYLGCPDTEYLIFAARRFRRLVGWSVFRRRGDAVAWGDALFHPRHVRAAEPILAAALAAPELAGARRIEGWFADNPPWWSERLGELGFSVRPEPQGLGMIALPDAEPEAFDELGKMYVTMGDGDLF